MPGSKEGAALGLTSLQNQFPGKETEPAGSAKSIEQEPGDAVALLLVACPPVSPLKRPLQNPMAL